MTPNLLAAGFLWKAAICDAAMSTKSLSPGKPQRESLWGNNLLPAVNVIVFPHNSPPLQLIVSVTLLKWF